MIEDIEKILREFDIEDAIPPTLEAALAIAAAIEQELAADQESLESHRVS